MSKKAQGLTTEELLDIAGLLAGINKSQDSLHHIVMDFKIKVYSTETGDTLGSIHREDDDEGHYFYAKVR